MKAERAVADALDRFFYLLVHTRRGDRGTVSQRPLSAPGRVVGRRIGPTRANPRPAGGEPAMRPAPRAQ
jgi:hypothetical protein